MKKYIVLILAVLVILILASLLYLRLVPKCGTNLNEVNEDPFVDIQGIPKPTLTVIPEISPQPIPSAEPEVSSSAEPAFIPNRQESKKQTTEYAFTLNIKGKKVNVAYGVDEATLKKTPGWLTTSVAPGEDGTCVVYGHRNRKHLRALEDVVIGDAIDVIVDGTTYSYEVKTIRILDNDEALTIPASEDAKLMLTTCYPFRYSGKTPKKCVIYCSIKKNLSID